MLGALIYAFFVIALPLHPFGGFNFVASVVTQAFLVPILLGAAAVAALFLAVEARQHDGKVCRGLFLFVCVGCAHVLLVSAPAMLHALSDKTTTTKNNTAAAAPRQPLQPPHGVWPLAPLGVCLFHHVLHDVSFCCFFSLKALW